MKGFSVSIVLTAVLALLGLTVLVFAGLYFFAPAKIADTAMSLERMRAGLHRSEMDIPGFHIVYLEGGPADAPPLLLLHGVGADKDNWTRVGGALTQRYRVYAVDLPGFGESGKTPGEHYRIEDQVRYVAEIAKVLKLDRFDLGGNSMGGWISAAYAIAHPEQVRSLWLLDPGGVVSSADSEMITMIKAGQPVPLFARTSEDFGRLLRFVMSKPPFVPAPVMAVLASRQAKNYDLNLSIFKQLREDSPALDAQLAALPSPLATPTLIVWGDQDRVLHYSGAEVLQRLLPNARVSIMPGIGHLPMLEAPGAAARAYLAFRDSLPAAR